MNNDTTNPTDAPHDAAAHDTTGHDTTGHDAAARGQVSRSAAEVYEDFFVPALFGQWPDRVLDTLEVQPGMTLLDVGTGTGVVARTAAPQVGTTGSVTAIDINDDMLTVARRSPEPVTWINAPAEQLPFDDASFDRVVSQFALMFLADRSAGLRQMARVLKLGGKAAVATWSSVDRSPGYAAMVALLDTMFGAEAADALRAPFTIGSAHQLEALLAPEFTTVSVVEHPGTARFDSIEAWVHTDVRGWTLADMIDDEQYNLLLDAATTELQPYVNDDGTVQFDAPALIAVATV